MRADSQKSSDLLNSSMEGIQKIYGLPEGYDAFYLADLLEKSTHKIHLHICADDLRMAHFERWIAFLNPKTEILTFPTWDCLPYDRSSPKNEFVGKRLEALNRLIHLADKKQTNPILVLTTSHAFAQKILPPSYLKTKGLYAKKGETLDLKALSAFAEQNGYNRVQTVREIGEYAIRGGIIDIYPPSVPNPYRLDLFGDEIEQIKIFDPLSQRTLDEATHLQLGPTSEIFMTEETISRFREAYRSLFGMPQPRDKIYHAVTEGRKIIGLEHWLPLFYEQMHALTDYLPSHFTTSLDPDFFQATQMRLEQIQDFYQARLDALAIETKMDSAELYRPIPKEQHYLSEQDISALLSQCAPIQFMTNYIDTGAERSYNFAVERTRPDINLFEAFKTYCKTKQTDGKIIAITSHSEGSRSRLKHLLSEHDFAHVIDINQIEDLPQTKTDAICLIALPLDHGFETKTHVMLSEQDILGDRLLRAVKKKRKADHFIQEIDTLENGELVIHQEHGLGRYDGLITLTINDTQHDCLKILYADDDKLFLPVENLELLSRYGTGSEGQQLDKLGSAAWQARKARVKKRLMDMADALLKIAAQRELQKADPTPVPEGIYEEFEARFAFDETEDQIKAIDDVMNDLQTGKLMDRLICGDVGFGKTEVAIRAAFLVASSNRQVAVVVPTTLLARQHFRSFKQRFEGLPFRIEQLSRLVKPKQMAQTKEAIANGEVDIIIGTHALLSSSLSFKNLGLLIIDEEQKFGVKQKERLKEIATDIHVLTLTATPIPRTLQLSLTGVKDLSLIATPPVDRLAVRTFVLPFDRLIIREAILREHFRGGQTYYVCPRIQDLDHVAARLMEIAPEVKFVKAHGQMPAAELEDVMNEFDQGNYDVLLATNIVESGLDIPNANTLIIHRSDLFGLAQLYQLRGRIGRSKQRGYAYLTYPNNMILTPIAKQRLHVLETLDSLGAGFTLASHDMDIRGAGNLLGEEQSGHVKEVGVELYQEMLREAVEEARHHQRPGVEMKDQHDWAPTIQLGASVLIPDIYVEDLTTRLSLYRRLSSLVEEEEIDSFAAELVDRFGPLPEEVNNLLEVISLKKYCRYAGISRLELGPKGIIISFRNNQFKRPEKLVQFIQSKLGLVKLRPDHRLIYIRSWPDRKSSLKGVFQFVKEIADLAI